MNHTEFRSGAYGLRCRHVVTMQSNRSPISDGMLLVQGDSITDVGPYHLLKKDFTGPIKDLGPKVLAPGLINAHTHLELSHLQGKTVLGQGFVPWIKSLIQLPLDEVDKSHIQTALSRLKQTSTAGIADFSGHSPETIYPLLADSGLEYTLFKEFLGFQPVKDIWSNWPSSLSPGRDTALTLAGHALYSTHPGTLQKCKTWTNRKHRAFAVHLAECPEEVELLATGRGAMADLLLGTLLPREYRPPGVSPVQYADQLGLLDPRSLVIHCVQAEKEDIQIVGERGSSICLCPRSNALIGVGAPPWEKMLQAGIPLCLGTDGLCSNTDLDLWGELKHLLDQTRTQYPLEEVLKMVTVNPSFLLGKQHRLGTLEPGRKARISIVPQEIVQRLRWR